MDGKRYQGKPKSQQMDDVISGRRMIIYTVSQRQPTQTFCYKFVKC